MKAEISEDGCLEIEAESGAEAYALQYWSANFRKNNGKAMLRVVGQVVKNPEDDE